MRILFLHHSTGQSIWDGGKASLLARIDRRLSARFGWTRRTSAFLPSLFRQHKLRHGKHYQIQEQVFPKAQPYGWRNYPFDYYNIWVKNAGTARFLEEPTLEILTKDCELICFKHCFPVSNIQPDLQAPNIDSEYRSLANYKLQYLAIRDKLHQFPNTKFLVWTAAAQVKSRIEESQAKRAREWVDWVLSDWDLPEDNVFLWDFYNLQTEGQLYFQEKFAESANNSHPNATFANAAARLLFGRIIDVIEANGSSTGVTGAPKREGNGAKSCS